MLKVLLLFFLGAKSSVAQNEGFLYTNLMELEHTRYDIHFHLETGSLTANTWTKITMTIPGNSNLTI